MNKTALVITSIAGPSSPVLETFSTECNKRNVPFIVIGDSKSPKNFHLEGCDYWSLERQATLEYKLASIIPTRHYARKNLGYLLALQNGAETIIETDDDNFPQIDFWQILDRTQHINAYDIKDQGWVNVYQYFSDTQIWPRGYPLEQLQEKSAGLDQFVKKEINCPIQQGLADDNPDVDAVYRLTYPLPLKFQKGVPIALGVNAWSPFNSQNTLWFKEAMPLLYLPSYCSFRMTDIWRSFIAQRIAWANDWSILYHESTVSQERNDHSLLKDFEDEIPGYLNNHKIAAALMELDLKAGKEHIYDNLIRCYEVMINNHWVEKEEMALVSAWAEDISSLL
jgi:hypothetical protein